MRFAELKLGSISDASANNISDATRIYGPNNRIEIVLSDEIPNMRIKYTTLVDPSVPTWLETNENQDQARYVHLNNICIVPQLETPK